MPVPCYAIVPWNLYVICALSIQMRGLSVEQQRLMVDFVGKFSDKQSAKDVSASQTSFVIGFIELTYVLCLRSPTYRRPSMNLRNNTPWSVTECSAVCLSA